jgi:hypothetical protein
VGLDLIDMLHPHEGEQLPPLLGTLVPSHLFRVVPQLLDYQLEESIVETEFDQHLVDGGVAEVGLKIVEHECEGGHHGPLESQLVGGGLVLVAPAHEVQQLVDVGLDGFT